MKESAKELPIMTNVFFPDEQVSEGESLYATDPRHTYGKQGLCRSDSPRLQFPNMRNA